MTFPLLRQLVYPATTPRLSYGALPVPWISIHQVKIQEPHTGLKATSRSVSNATWAQMRISGAEPRPALLT
jgi:hypothetical protein